MRVVEIVHGDGRSQSFAANLALSGLTLRAAIDPARIAASGERAGAHTVLAALGGIDLSGRVPALADPRVKAVVGIMPFMGAIWEHEGTLC